MDLDGFRIPPLFPLDVEWQHSSRLPRCHLPAAKAFGFVAELRQNTGGQAFPQFRLDHWWAAQGRARACGLAAGAFVSFRFSLRQNVSLGDAMDAGSKAAELVLNIRKAKGLKEALPSLADYAA